eukprot:s60_g54.t1
MSRVSSPGQHEEVKLSIQLPGGLSVVVRAPAGASALAADLLRDIALFEPSGVPAVSEASFELVSDAGSSASRVAPRPETRDSILRSFPVCPARLFKDANRLCGSSVSGRERIQRAWTAGSWAAAVLHRRVGSPNRTPALDLRSRYYAVVAAPGLEEPTIFQSAASYWKVIGSLEDSPSISQSFPSELEAKEGDGEALVLVVQKRPGGFLVAVPIGFLPEEVLAVGNSQNPPGPVGPSTVVVVPLVLLDNGVLTPTGGSASVLVVDLSEDVLPQLRLPSAFEQKDFAFDPDQPFGIPQPQELLLRVRDWLVAAGDSSAEGYLSVMQEVEDLDGKPLEEGDLDLEEVPQGTANGGVAAPKAASARRKQPAHGPERPTLGAKKPTVASLASALDQLLQSNQGMSNQLQALSQRQLVLEQQLVAAPPQSSSMPCSALRLPISASLNVPRTQPQSVAKSLGTPPRTVAPCATGLLQSPSLKPPALAELEGEKILEGQSTSSDPLARAVMVQAQALTELVGQIASQSSDPLVDLVGGSGSAGTRGAVGRAKLQMELAQQKGLFFQSVLTQMARRMQPTQPAQGSPQDLLARGVCGSQYLERYGGYAKHRELGHLQFQVMSIMDFLQAGNWDAAKDATALLSVVLDQACLDNGRFDLAHLLCLQEEPPTSIFTHKPAHALSRTKAFSPLADQKWVTVALAYLKELDTITAKRLELGGQKPNAFGSASTDEGPKAKAQPKKKQKGGGKGAQQKQESEEA